MEKVELIKHCSDSRMYAFKKILEDRGVFVFTEQIKNTQDAELRYKILVHADEYYLAYSILEESGAFNQPDVAVSSKFVVGLYRFSNKIPVVNKLGPLSRLVALGAVPLVVAGVLYLTLFYKKSEEANILTNNTWCMEAVAYQNRPFYPETKTGRDLSKALFCPGQTIFFDNGEIQLPGFRSRAVNGKWDLKDDRISITACDTFDFLYNGTYAITFESDRIVLKSDSAQLFLTKNKFSRKSVR